jgi:hypothetical protein
VSTAMEFRPLFANFRDSGRSPRSAGIAASCTSMSRSISRRISSAKILLDAIIEGRTNDSAGGAMAAALPADFFHPNTEADDWVDVFKAGT